jgi:hypothetical protein
VTVVFNACKSCLDQTACAELGCAITRTPPYKGPPALTAPADASVWATCEGCPTPRKCRDLTSCTSLRGKAPKSAVTTHDLKCWPEFFCPVRDRLKTFEVRYNDRDYKVNDRLYLREFMPCPKCKGSGTVERVVERTDGDPYGVGPRVDTIRCDCLPPHGLYTGRQEIHVVTYVLSEYVGLQPEYVVLGLRPLFQGG